jgi:flagellar operon protein
MSIDVPNAALVPPGVAPVAPPPPAQQNAPAGELRGPSFADVLGTQTGGVEFSRHAAQRLERRGIDVDASTMNRLSDGVDRAASKGSRSSVVLVDGTAFVVSVPSRTVITAVDPGHMREQVFTNIDSAVIA